MRRMACAVMLQVGGLVCTSLCLLSCGLDGRVRVLAECQTNVAKRNAKMPTQRKRRVMAMSKVASRSHKL